MMNLCPWRLEKFRRGGAELLAPPCSTEEFHWSQIRASRSGRDLTLKESEVMGVEYEMGLFFWPEILPEYNYMAFCKDN